MDLPVIIVLLGILVAVCGLSAYFVMQSGPKEEDSDQDNEDPETTTDAPECKPTEDIAAACGSGKSSWDPVCGVDGKTYGSACFAEARCVPVAYKGPCRDPEPCSMEDIECAEVDMPVCGLNGTQYKNACHAVKDCTEVAYRGPCQWLVACKVNPEGVCPAVMEPVCGSDGKTYNNACEARKMCVQFVPGRCPSSGTS